MSQLTDPFPAREEEYSSDQQPWKRRRENVPSVWSLEHCEGKASCAPITFAIAPHPPKMAMAIACSFSSGKMWTRRFKAAGMVLKARCEFEFESSRLRAQEKRRPRTHRAALDDVDETKQIRGLVSEAGEGKRGGGKEDSQRTQLRTRLEERTWRCCSW